LAIYGIYIVCFTFASSKCCDIDQDLCLDAYQVYGYHCIHMGSKPEVGSEFEIEAQVNGGSRTVLEGSFSNPGDGSQPGTREEEESVGMGRTSAVECKCRARF
jgi:hypothetical protein